MLRLAMLTLPASVTARDAPADEQRHVIPSRVAASSSPGPSPAGSSALAASAQQAARGQPAVPPRGGELSRLLQEAVLAHGWGELTDLASQADLRVSGEYIVVEIIFTSAAGGISPKSPCARTREPMERASDETFRS